MALSNEEIEHVARLGRLNLNDEEKQNMKSDLTEILSYVEELENAPTEGLTPISQISGMENIVRADQIEPSLENAKIMQNAPAVEKGFLKVKKVFK